MGNPEFGTDAGQATLYRAVLTLIAAAKPIQQKLWDVSAELLSLDIFDVLPTELRPELKAIVFEMTCIEGVRSSFVAALPQMKDEDALRLAERILNLYIELRCRA